MLSCSSSTNFSQNMYSCDFYAQNRSSINSYTLNKLIKDENYDQLFDLNDPLFDNFLTEYNNGREYEKNSVMNGDMTETPIPKLLLINSEDSNFDIQSTCGSEQSDFLRVPASNSLVDVTYSEMQKSAAINKDTIKETFINDYLNSFQSAIYNNFDLESSDLSLDTTLVAEQNVSLNETTQNIPRRRPSPRKQNSPSTVKRSSKTSGENTPKKGHKYSNRHRFKEYQIEILEKEFQKDYYPNGVAIDRISSSLGVTYHTVTVWFQNRRARLKRSMEKRVKK